MPALVGGFGNYMLPVLIGAPDYLLKKIMKPKYLISKTHHFHKLIKPSLHLKNESQKFFFGSYIAGLFEGDGHIILSKNISQNKISYPYLAITFAKKDLPLINKLVELFGGRLRFKEKENAIVWIINKHEELINLVYLINGFLRTPKIIKFNNLIKWLNDRYQYNIKINTVDSRDLKTNNWLAGFIDADGGFKIRYTEKRLDNISGKVLTKERIEVRFALEQRQNLQLINTSYENIMVEIQNFFNLENKLKTSKHNNREYWIVEIASLNRLKFIIEYLKNFPLLTAKRNDFEDWLKVYYLIENKEHLTESGKLQIKKIKSNFNNNRKTFHWDHLFILNN